MTKVLLTIFGLLLAGVLTAQVSLEAVVSGEDMDLDWPEGFGSVQEVQEFLSREVASQRISGRPSFSVDSVNIDDIVCIAYVHPGPLIAADMGGDVNEIVDRIDELEDSGHPFARLEMDTRLISDSLERKIRFTQGPLILFDSLIAINESDIATEVIGLHLGIYKGRPYAERLIEDADRKLRQLPFLKVVRPTAVIFAGDAARVFLGVEERPADQVEGIIGFQPDAQGNVVFTGEVRLELQNAFSHLDEIGLIWQRVADNTQNFDFRIRYPYLFKTRIGIEGEMDQYRQDSTFNQVHLDLGVFTILENSSEFKAFVSSRSVNDLLGEQGVDGASSRTVQYGVQYGMNSLDDQFNPRKGMKSRMSLSYGDKEVGLSADAGENLTVDQWMVDFEGKYFFPLGTRGALLARGIAKHIASERIILNELHREGGFHSLRGFDEQSIRASSFALVTAEYRFLNGERSFLSLFVDQGWYERKGTTQYLRDTPLGVGVGASFETASGMLVLNYAIGNSFGQGFDFRSGKIHFGYSALF